MNKHIFFTILLIIFFTGCSFNRAKPVDILSKKVQELNITDKRHIYKIIENEIKIYNTKGDEAFNAQEYYNALKYYEVVNFYKGYAYIPDKKLNNIKKNIYKKSVYHYKVALKTQNNKKKLKELNIVMMNNPNYKNTKILYKNSKEKNKIFINSLENTLYTQLSNHNFTLEDIQNLEQKSQELHQYKYSSNLIAKIRNLLKKEHTKLFNQAVELYENNNLKDAKKSFTILTSIYNNDQKSKKYLQKIELKEHKKLLLSKASKSFSNKNYKNAMFYAKKILLDNPNNKEAKTILLNSKKLSRQKVKKLLNEGKYNYSLKRLEKAKNLFTLVLEIDAKNAVAILYKSKIDRQLKTITSLQ